MRNEGKQEEKNTMNHSDNTQNTERNIQVDGENKKKRNIVRRLYDWVLGWAEKPSSKWALFILAFAESSFFPVPPDVLLIPVVLGDRKKWYRLALMVTIASILGGAFGYFIGHFLWLDSTPSLDPSAVPVYSDFAKFCFDHIPGLSQDVFNSIRIKYHAYGFLIVFTAGFSPIPYKIFTISSGAFGLNFFTFMLASVISRGARFFLVSFLLFWFGEPIKIFIDKYFNWLALVFTVLLIGGFVLIKGAM